MRIKLTAHARYRCMLRGITAAMVEEAIAEPDDSGTGYNDRSIATKSFGERGRIRVVYSIERDIAVVITVIWSR